MPHIFKIYLKIKSYQLIPMRTPADTLSILNYIIRRQGPGHAVTVDCFVCLTVVMVRVTITVTITLLPGCRIKGTFNYLAEFQNLLKLTQIFLNLLNDIWGIFNINLSRSFPHGVSESCWDLFSYSFLWKGPNIHK